MISPRSTRAAGKTWRANPQAARKPSTTEKADDRTATNSELTSALTRRGSLMTAWYQRSDGPVKGGMGSDEA